MKNGQFYASAMRVVIRDQQRADAESNDPRPTELAESIAEYLDSTFAYGESHGPTLPREAWAEIAHAYKAGAELGITGPGERRFASQVLVHVGLGL